MAGLRVLGWFLCTLLTHRAISIIKQHFSAASFPQRNKEALLMAFKSVLILGVFPSPSFKYSGNVKSLFYRRLFLSFTCLGRESPGIATATARPPTPHLPLEPQPSCAGPDSLPGLSSSSFQDGLNSSLLLSTHTIFFQTAP